MRRYRQSEELLTGHSITERLQSIDGIRWIKPQESWDSSRRRFERRGHYVTISEIPYVSEYRYIEPDPMLPVEFSSSYGDWSEIRNTDELGPDTYILLDRTSYSDYSGSIIEASNHKVFADLLQAAQLEDGSGYIDYYGGHGTRALAVSLKSLQDALPDENGWIQSILDTLESLDDYPVADESEWSEMESESQNEAWESWAKSDFKSELEKYFAAYVRARIETADDYADTFGSAGLCSIACTEALAEFIESEEWIPDLELGTWFYQLADYANENWVNDQGTDSYIDVADVVTNGFGRDIWPEGKAKREALASEIAEFAIKAYARYFYQSLVA